MTVFRWIIGVIAALLASGTAIAFLLYIVGGENVWQKRARNLRRLTSAALMFWFNVEIWRHVILIIIHW
jgi:high-affinity Fe2+/Pb2+ permease